MLQQFHYFLTVIQRNNNNNNNKTYKKKTTLNSYCFKINFFLVSPGLFLHIIFFFLADIKLGMRLLWRQTLIFTIGVWSGVHYSPANCLFTTNFLLVYTAQQTFQANPVEIPDWMYLVSESEKVWMYVPIAHQTHSSMIKPGIKPFFVCFFKFCRFKFFSGAIGSPSGT